MAPIALLSPKDSYGLSQLRSRVRFPTDSIHTGELGRCPKMGTKIRKVLKTNKLLKSHQWAMLSRGVYLVGSAEFCPLKLGLNRASCCRMKAERKGKSASQERPLVSGAFQLAYPTM